MKVAILNNQGIYTSTMAPAQHQNKGLLSKTEFNSLPGESIFVTGSTFRNSGTILQEAFTDDTELEFKIIDQNELSKEFKNKATMFTQEIVNIVS